MLIDNGVSEGSSKNRGQYLFGNRMVRMPDARNYLATLRTKVPYSMECLVLLLAFFYMLLR